MKRIVSFVLLACVFAVILMLPATPAPARESHPIPVWSILSYVGVVLGAAVAVFLMKKDGMDEVETAKKADTITA